MPGVNLNPTVKERIVALLESNFTIRDSPEQIMEKIWFEEAINLGIVGKRALLRAMAKKQLTSSETIRRTWQLIMRDRPDLRGHNYTERINKSNTVKEQVKSLAHV